MTDPLRPIGLTANLPALEAVLKVCCGIPGSAPRQTAVPWVFPEVGAAGNVLPGGDTAQNTRASCTYDIVSIVGLGNDELRREYDPDLEIPGDLYEPDPLDPLARLGGVVESVSGNRVITVQFRAEVRGGNDSPFVYLERVRTRLMLPTVGDALDAAGFAVADVGDARPHDFRDDSGLTVRAAILEIVLNAADCATDDPITTIEQTDYPVFEA